MRVPLSLQSCQYTVFFIFLHFCQSGREVVSQFCFSCMCEFLCFFICLRAIFVSFFVCALSVHVSVRFLAYYTSIFKNSLCIRGISPLFVAYVAGISPQLFQLSFGFAYGMFSYIIFFNVNIDLPAFLLPLDFKSWIKASSYTKVKE